MAEKDSKESRKNEEQTVEQNLSDSYIPKGKLGDLPITNQLDKEMKKEMDKTKNDIDKLKKELTKQFKYIEAIGIVPAQASKKIEEEYEITEEDAAKKLIHLLVVIPEDKFKEIQKVRLECIKKAKEINNKLWVHVMTPVDIWNLALDSKFDIVEAFAMSYPILDKGLLGALRVSEIHRTLVLRKFEKYVTSYVIAGSLVRGEAKPTSDVDIFIIIDDTDVKRMNRFELKERLRSVILNQYVPEATAIAGVKNLMNVQVYLMTEFWEAVKDAIPVMFTFIRDGVPLYDRGAFLPWKSLLRMGKIKPSPEAIDMFMSSGDKLEESINRRIMDIAVLDIYWGTLTPSQGILMMYGLAPPTPKETVKLIREVFCEKEKLIEKKYVDIIEGIISYYKEYEHGKHKKMTGAELDKMASDALSYIKRLKELREQLEKRIQDKSIQQIYDDVFKMLESLLNKKGENVLIKEFEEEFVKKGRFPPRFIENLKFIAKTKKEFEELDKDKKKKLTSKEIGEIENARKKAAELTNTLVEYVQRKEFSILDRRRFLLKTKEQVSEVFFLDEIYVVSQGKISVIKSGKLFSSNIESLNKSLADAKNKDVKINPKDIEGLKSIFGDFELGY